MADFSSLIATERALRKRLFAAPTYFAGDLSELERHHAHVACSIEESIEQEGWPGILWVGFDRARDAAELVRSCWSEPAFMRKCLPFLEHGYRFGEGRGEWFAMHYDTVMYFENKPQVFGMVMEWDNEGELSPWKIIDPADVNKRRRSIQTAALEDYVRRCRDEAVRDALRAPDDVRAYRLARDRWASARGWRREGES